MAQQEYDLKKRQGFSTAASSTSETTGGGRDEKGEDLSLVHESVTDEEIARIVSRWTGIPVAKLTERGKTKPCIWRMNFISG